MRIRITALLLFNARHYRACVFGVNQTPTMLALAGRVHAIIRITIAVDKSCALIEHLLSIISAPNTSFNQPPALDSLLQEKAIHFALPFPFLHPHTPHTASCLL